MSKRYIGMNVFRFLFFSMKLKRRSLTSSSLSSSTNLFSSPPWGNFSSVAESSSNKHKHDHNRERDTKQNKMMQQQQQQQQLMTTNSQVEHPSDSVDSTAEAPPKQVALAMERLSRAARLIADIRLGADRLLEALFVTAQPHQTNKPVHLILKEEASMRQHLQDLRNVGRQLEDSGVLNGSLKSRSNSWGLHMPLVCPDGAVVAYAWKRQLAGQAGASAVDRTRLALKAFTDQKRRFFPHLEDESSGESKVSKKHCGPQGSAMGPKEVLTEDKTLSDVLMRMEKETPNVKIFTYQRLDWSKRASSLSSSSNETPIDLFKELSFHNSNKLRAGSQSAVAVNQVAVVEVFVPSVFRAIVSLHPAGSIDPDSVAFFSPVEGGSYLHSRGFSVHQVFRCVTEHAVKALQYFLGTETDMALYHLLQWISSYQTLFLKACSKCGRLLKIDKQSALILPPVHRTYRHSSAVKLSSIQSTKDQSLELITAYHVGCSSEEA